MRGDGKIQKSLQRGDRRTVYVEHEQTDRIVEGMRSKHLLTDARIAVSIGIKEEHYNLAFNRGRYSKGIDDPNDERDTYLYCQVEQARAEVEGWLQEGWISGEVQGAQSYLLALSKRYNAKYREDLNEELAHMMGIVSKRVTQDQMLQIVDDIIEFQPSLEFDGEAIEVALPSLDSDDEGQGMSGKRGRR